ncbi:MAG: MATE family efflux transporter [bacterium]|nr:MATE family efflux transporter [bacterium]
MTGDMTVGNPVKKILLFMIPVCLGNIFQQFYNLADSIIAGQFLGVNALAAIGATGSLVFLVVGWLNGITSGFAVLISQSFGAKRYDEMRHYMAMSIYLCVFFVAIMTVSLELLNTPILRLMNSPEELFVDIHGYMAVIYAGLAATAAYNALAAILRAIGDSRTPLYFLIVSSVVNVVLDIVFITWLHLGVMGCAYATVAAQAISALLCYVYIRKKFEFLHLRKEDFTFSWKSAKKMLALGVPMGLQFSITAIGTIIVQGAINVYGSVSIAGFSAGSKIQNIVSTVFVSFGATTATYVGQNLGAGELDRVKLGVRKIQMMILIWGLVMMAIIYLFGGQMVRLFIGSGDTGVTEVAETYFRVVAWCYPFLGSIYLYRNALQGMGYGFIPMMGGVFELAARALVVMLVSGRGSFAAVCASDPAAWIAALLPLVPYYFMIEAKFSKKAEQSKLA